MASDPSRRSHLSTEGLQMRAGAVTNGASRKPGSNPGLVHIQPAGVSTGPSSASSLPSPSSFSFPSLSPDVSRMPSISSTEALRRQQGQNNGTLRRSSPHEQYHPHHTTHPYISRNLPEHEAKSQTPNDYRDGSHYDYMDAMQHASQAGLTPSYLGK